MGLKSFFFYLSFILFSGVYGAGGDAIYTINSSDPDTNNPVYMFDSLGNFPPSATLLSLSVPNQTSCVTSPSGNLLYLLSDNPTAGAFGQGEVYSLLTDGLSSPTLLGSVAYGASADKAVNIEISPLGDILYIGISVKAGGVEIVSMQVNSPTTQITLIDTSGGSETFIGMSISTDGVTGYLLAGGTNQLYSFSTTTSMGSLTTIPTSPAINKPSDLATLDASNLVISQGPNVYSVAVTGGSMTTIGDLTGGANKFTHLAMSVDRSLVIGSGDGGLYSVPSNGSSDPGTPIVIFNHALTSLKDLAVGPGLSPPPPPPPGPPPPPPGPPASSLFPPSNVRGVSHKIGSLSTTVYYNQLDWDAPVGGNVPTSGYLIYRNGLLVVEIPTEVYTWQDPNTPQGATSVTYAIVSASPSSQSSPVFVTVTREAND